MTFDAVVLAGGAGRRLGGVVKADVERVSPGDMVPLMRVDR